MLCGNSILDILEECDDMNILDGDGCSNHCLIESGYEWLFDPNHNNISIWHNVCGNGILNLSEQCDDNNTINNDGCSNTCIIEPNYECFQFNRYSICRLKWGNGILDYGEQWDDGNKSNGDGCSNDCIIQSGFIWENFINKESFCYNRREVNYLLVKVIK